METTQAEKRRRILGRMEKKMETIDIIGFIWGLQGILLGLYGDNGKENGNYYTGRPNSPRPLLD